MAAAPGARIDEDCNVSTYSTIQSTSILGAFDLALNAKFIIHTHDIQIRLALSVKAEREVV